MIIIIQCLKLKTVLIMRLYNNSRLTLFNTALKLITALYELVELRRKCVLPKYVN